MQELKELLKNNEWVIGYIWGDFCKACEANKPIMDEVEKETPDIKIFKIDVKNEEYAELMKEVDFESLPYYAIFHNKKEEANPENPISCFIGGETGAGREMAEQIIGMIRQFNAKNVV